MATTGVRSNALRDDGTEVVMHSNYRYWRDDHERLMGYRVPRLPFAFQKFTDAVANFLKTVDPATIDFSFPEPTITFDRRLELTMGGRRLEIAWTPGGETTDSLSRVASPRSSSINPASHFWAAIRSRA